MAYNPYEKSLERDGLKNKSRGGANFDERLQRREARNVKIYRKYSCK